MPRFWRLSKASRLKLNLHINASSLEHNANMITRLPTRISSIASALRPVSRSATRCIHHIKSRPSLQFQFNSRHQHQHLRFNSTSPLSPTEPTKPIDIRSQLSSASPPPPNPQPQPQPTPKRSLRPYIYATTFFLLGLTIGQYIRLILAPPPAPPPNSKEDIQMTTYLQSQASSLPLVKSLSTDPAWTHHDAYTSLPAHERPHRLTTGPLAGARALGGYQRIFFNQESGETITVIWFGGAIAGWPGVTHGGVIATVMDESLGRCAIRRFPGRSGVTANLELNYLKPVVTNSFYIIRAVPEERKGGEERKCWVSARLETVDGVVCVESKALFVVPKKYRTRAIGGEF